MKKDGPNTLRGGVLRPRKNGPTRFVIRFEESHLLLRAMALLAEQAEDPEMNGEVIFIPKEVQDG